MESIAYKSDIRRKSLQNQERHRNMQQTQVTPQERLRTVDDFIGKLEQAVFERL